MSWDIVVCIVPSLQAGHLMNYLIPIRGKRFLQSSQISSWIHPATCSVGIRISFHGVKQQGNEADQSLLNMHMDNFPFTLTLILYYNLYNILAVCTDTIFRRVTQISYFEYLLMN